MRPEGNVDITYPFFAFSQIKPQKNKHYTFLLGARIESVQLCARRESKENVRMRMRDIGENYETSSIMSAIFFERRFAMGISELERRKRVYEVEWRRNR